MAGCYWGLIGGLLGEKSGSRSPKWFQDLEGTPKPIPHRWHFPLGQNAYSEVLGATNGHHIHQVVGKLYVKCNFRTFLISLEPYCSINAKLMMGQNQNTSDRQPVLICLLPIIGIPNYYGDINLGV